MEFGETDGFFGEMIEAGFHAESIAVSKRVPPDLRDAIRRVLLSLGDDPRVRERLAGGLVERFVLVTAADYDDIRAMLDACEAAGFMQLRCRHGRRRGLLSERSARRRLLCSVRRNV